MVVVVVLQIEFRIMNIGSRATTNINEIVILWKFMTRWANTNTDTICMPNHWDLDLFKTIIIIRSISLYMFRAKKKVRTERMDVFISVCYTNEIVQLSSCAFFQLHFLLKYSLRLAAIIPIMLWAVCSLLFSRFRYNYGVILIAN